MKNLDINSLLGNVQNAANVAIDAYNMIGELFDQESPLQTAIDKFNENVNNLDVQDLMYQAQEVSKNNANTIVEIINLTNQLTELEKSLAASMNEYYNFLKENSLDKTADATKEATEAVKTAKASIDTLNTTLNNLSVVWTPNTSTEDPNDGYWAFGPTPQQS